MFLYNLHKINEIIVRGWGDGRDEFKTMEDCKDCLDDGRNAPIAARGLCDMF